MSLSHKHWSKLIAFKNEEYLKRLKEIVDFDTKRQYQGKEGDKEKSHPFRRGVKRRPR